MKKVMMMAALIMVLSLVLAACTQNIPDQQTPATSGDETATMDKDDDMAKEDEMKDEMVKDGDMAKDDMAKDDMDSGHSDDMDKEGDMKKDDMDEEKAMMTNEGEQAPGFELMALDGSTVNLEDLKGQKVYVKFWASWCSICVSGLPELDDLSGSNETFTVLTIVSPGASGEKSAEAFKEWFAGKNTKNIVVLFDEGGEVRREYGVRGVPTSAYIGSDGVLVKTMPGHVGNDQIRASFEDIH